MNDAGTLYPVEDVAVAQTCAPRTGLRHLAAEVIAARVVAGLEAGRPAVVAARLWSWTTPSTYGNGRVVGLVEAAAPRPDANNVLGIRAADAWALEIMCGVVAEERGRGRPAGNDWPGAREAVSLAGDG